MDTQTYGTIAENYKGAIAWMNSLGIRIERNRAAHYAKTISYWAENFQTATDEEADVALLEFSNAVLEIADFVEIYKSLGELPLDQLSGLAEKLEKSVNGPVSSLEEKSSNVEARNFLFEALVAARCHRPMWGIESVLKTKADCQIRFEGVDIFAECKRIGSIKKIEANAKDASAQAQRHLVSNSKQGRAIVAFDITKLFDASGKVYRYEKEDDLRQYIAESTSAFIVQYSNLWDKVYKRRDARLIGTMFRFSHLAVDQKSNMLITVNNWSVLPKSRSKISNGQMLERIVEALNA